MKYEFPKNYTYTVTCKCCKTATVVKDGEEKEVIEAVDAEGDFGEAVQYDMIVYYIDCPKCGKFIKCDSEPV